MTRSWLRELRRRHVFRVAAGYAVVGWLLIQIATQVFPFFHIPDWSVRLLVLLVLAGFPVALVLAWAFDATPHGIVRTEPEGQPVLRRGPHGTLTIGVIGVVIAVILGAVYWWSHRGTVASVPPAPQVATASNASRTPVATPHANAAGDLALPQTMAGLVPVEPKSIAVLPFENMSADPDNRYFAEGMQDMILTKLADIGDLKVISRTSTEKYASRPDNLKAVARQLAVANILEGSVQKVGKQVLINVQLIDARTDDHLWAQAYTRTLDNVFGVEGEVAQQIAQALHAQLSEREQQALSAKPTQNADAWDAYLRGLASNQGAGGNAVDYRRTAGFYSDAVKRDPDFALAWARLSEIDSRIYQMHFDRSPSLAAEAKQAAAAALKLAPDSGEAWLAQGFYLSRVEADYPEALAALANARTRLPNSGEVLAAFSDIEARQGQWQQAINNIDMTSIVDPRNARLLLQHVRLHAMRREWPDASAVLAHARAIAPDDVSLIACEASIAQALGQVDKAQTLLAPLPTQPDDPSAFETRVMQWLYQHQYAAAINALQAAVAKPESSPGDSIGDDWYLLGFAQQLAGNASAARATWQSASIKLAALQKAFPDEAGVAADLGLVYAGLGEKGNAIAEGKRAMQLQPASTDATQGPAWQEQLARIEAQTGEVDRSIEELQHLLRTPYRSAFYATAITPSLLRQDPAWNPLRKDPRFQALLKTSSDTTPMRSAMPSAHG
jgi:TolB-like protein/Tfp pilus assembly protein PilF